MRWPSVKGRAERAFSRLVQNPHKPKPLQSASVKPPTVKQKRIKSKSTENRQLKRRLLQLGAGCLIGAIFLLLVLHQVDAQAVWQEILRVRPVPLIGACALLILAYAARAERWHLTLHTLNPALARSVTGSVFLLGIAANCMLPFRLGDVLRGTVFSRRLGVVPPAVLATLLLEKVLDLLTVLLAGGLALVVLNARSSQALSTVAPVQSGSVLLAGGAGLVLALFGLKHVRFVRTWLSRGWGNLKHTRKLMALSGQSLEALEAAGQHGVLLRLLGWSALAWTLEGSAFWEVARAAVPRLSAPSAAWLAMPMATLSTALPGMPGSVGTFDYFAARVMAGLGNAPEAATAYAFVVHATVMLVPVLLAGVVLAGLLFRLFSERVGKPARGVSESRYPKGGE